MKAIKSAKIQRQSWIYRMQQFLRAYRCTRHTTTRFTTYRLLFGHDPRTNLPDAESFTHPDDSNVHERDAEGKNIMKCYAGKRLHAEAKPTYVRDTVLVKQPQLNKLSTPLIFSPNSTCSYRKERNHGHRPTRWWVQGNQKFLHVPQHSQTLIQEGDTCDESCENILPSRKKRPRQPEETRKSRYIRLS